MIFLFLALLAATITPPLFAENDSAQESSTFGDRKKEAFQTESDKRIIDVKKSPPRETEAKNDAQSWRERMFPSGVMRAGDPSQTASPTGSALPENKFVGVYTLSNSTLRNYDRFTPQLIEFYKKNRAIFEVVFVPSGFSESGARNLSEEMPWLMSPLNASVDIPNGNYYGNSRTTLRGTYLYVFAPDGTPLDCIHDVNTREIYDTRLHGNLQKKMNDWLEANGRGNEVVPLETVEFRWSKILPENSLEAYDEISSRDKKTKDKNASMSRDLNGKFVGFCRAPAYEKKSFQTELIEFYRQNSADIEFITSQTGRDTSAAVEHLPWLQFVDGKAPDLVPKLDACGITVFAPDGTFLLHISGYEKRDSIQDRKLLRLRERMDEWLKEHGRSSNRDPDKQAEKKSATASIWEDLFPDGLIKIGQSPTLANSRLTSRLNGKFVAFCDYQATMILTFSSGDRKHRSKRNRSTIGNVLQHEESKALLDFYARNKKYIEIVESPSDYSSRDGDSRYWQSVRAHRILARKATWLAVPKDGKTSIHTEPYCINVFAPDGTLFMEFFRRDIIDEKKFRESLKKLENKMQIWLKENR